MWKVTYNVLILMVLPFFILYSLTKGKIRKSLAERLFPQPLRKEQRGLFWIHAASVGEAVIAENIVNAMGSGDQAEKFVVTANTYYTRDMLRKKWNGRIPVFSLPFDLPFSVARFMDSAGIRALLIVETEIWPNLIWLAKKKGIPVIIVNGRISDRTVKRYARFSSFMKSVFSSVDLVLAQSEEHKQRFISIGMDPEKVRSTGNLKYCRQAGQGQESRPKGKVITFGSIKEKEMGVVVAVAKRLKQAFPDHRIFVVPRELHLVVPLEQEFVLSFNVMRYSVYKDLPNADPAVVIVDTVGDLLSIYGKSRVAFVGGSLAPYGGQNILEPLFFGTPVVFGPFVENFREIADQIVSRHAGVMVKTEEELLQQMTAILRDESLQERMGEAGTRIILEQRQVMERTVEAVMEVAWKNSQN
jgi:3-deoxy-D-manno-octulosonic-acid transferase